MRQRAAPGAGPLLVAGVAILVWAERRWPLRRRTAPGGARRAARNLALAGLSAITVQAVERPLVTPLARLVAERRVGLLPSLGLPGWIELPAALALMDYTLYLWHRLTHRVPFLWRFHRVHHADLDMDATTAIRFHAGEFLLSAPYRAAQVLLIGVRPRALLLWQRLTLAAVVFHHANLRLPLSLECALVRLVVTPQMHGIHHSVVPAEADSNWSSVLTAWDRLHGTLRLNVPQAAVTIGVAELRPPRDVAFVSLVAMPFRRQRRAMRVPESCRPGLPSSLEA